MLGRASLDAFECLANHHSRTLRNGLSAVSMAVMLVLSGCAHRAVRHNATYTLRSSDYPIIVPSFTPKEVVGKNQTTVVPLPEGQLSGLPGAVSQCTIEGSTFSLQHGPLPNSDKWYFRSPNPEGWRTLDPSIDIRSEWQQFERELSGLVIRGCFSSKVNVQLASRTIVERVPLPATEAMLFYYRFGQDGFVDLGPGMRMQIERALYDEALGKGLDAYRGSLRASYRVVSQSGHGVGLQRYQNDQKASTSEARKNAAMFNLARLTAGKPFLRLFLGSLQATGASQVPILIAAASPVSLEDATKQVVAQGERGCASLVIGGFSCFSFHGSVSIFSTVWVNNRRYDAPLGTSLGSLLQTVLQSDSARSIALQSISLRRQLEVGGVATVECPRTLDAAKQVILLTGDRVSWK
jgi:hypothetical protein